MCVTCLRNVENVQDRSGEEEPIFISSHNCMVITAHFSTRAAPLCSMTNIRCRRKVLISRQAIIGTQQLDLPLGNSRIGQRDKLVKHIGTIAWFGALRSSRQSATTLCCHVLWEKRVGAKKGLVLAMSFYAV
ncbi:hypothetical protein AMATHDRAFT_66213 [Amanita thiersii Skay4041]|uniref:Uncharacterized protein n=1 Tax=Amanita thiersii Skay4041 TaxID=703135 RepID=A0A2A9NK25_9AGAR|nr:hypothetical protein AMATHDRAFT_66213 [Amanita thiersii Skay4041]